MNVQAAQQRFVSIPVSPIEGVSNVAWFRFITVLEAQSHQNVTKSGALGAYEMLPRRLGELGYLTNLRREDGGKKQVGTFVGPWTEEKFLADSVAQYVAFRKSILLYYRQLMSGAIQRPKGISIAGALAILHRGGEGALKKWPKLFEGTKKVYDRVKECF
jgi:hypothetical protein